MPQKWIVVLIVLLLAGVGFGLSGGASLLRRWFGSANSDAVNSATTNIETNDPLTGKLNLPPDVVSLLRTRITLDKSQQGRHLIEPMIPAAPRRLGRPRKQDDQIVKVFSNHVAAATLAYRRSIVENTPPLRGYRAPLQDEAVPAVILDSAKCNEAELRAAALIEERLAHDGLLSTLAQVIAILGPSNFSRGDIAEGRRLSNLGFPIDLTTFFGSNGSRQAPFPLIAEIGKKLAAGKSAAALAPELARLPFAFKASGTFAVMTESAEHEVGMLRLQLGGGYYHGIVPGGTLDMAVQLLNVVTNVDYVVTVPGEHVTSFQSLAENYSQLTRPAQLTIVTEPLALSAWAQDSGKAGVTRAADGSMRIATLAPRYASKGEADSNIMPGDTFLMTGLAAAGHAVVSSPLLFQGGNLIAVVDPKTKRRILLIGETEVYRNTSLGLTRDQVLETFRIELGVDECVVLPLASFHIDFDLSVRSHGGRLIVFVNDSAAAARIIVRRGADPLEQTGVLSPDVAAKVREASTRGDDRFLVETLMPLLQRQTNVTGRFPASLAQRFAVDQFESAEINFGCFLVALEFLASRVPVGNTIPADGISSRYFQVLRDIEAAAKRQVEQLQKLGWTIVPVPSLPDFTPTLNYLNGIQDRSRYLMPANGGFYRVLDDAARQVFQTALGSDVTIVPILSSESQRQHGAVHCAVAAYPRIEAGAARTE